MTTKSVLLLGSVLAALSGCADLTPTVDQHFGMAFTQTKLGQTIDPQAAQHPGNAMGIDGKAAKETMKRYVDSFKEPPPAINVINIGGSLSGNGNGSGQ